MGLSKEQLQQIEHDLKSGEKFSSMVTIRPISPSSLFVYIFCLEINRFENLVDSLVASVSDKNKIKACRWDLLTVDVIYHILVNTLGENSLTAIKGNLIKRCKKSLALKYGSSFSPSALSLHDIIHEFNSDEIPVIVKELLARFKPVQKISA